MGTGVAFVAPFLRKNTRPNRQMLRPMFDDLGKQAAQVAIPIASIGIIIAVAIQSNLAIKFSTRLMEISGGTLLGAMIFIIIGCIIMGMGMPTVAAYIIGAVLFVPALRKLGIPELASHMFVMYYCVLSMITPPVALASYAGASLAKANFMRTGWIAFRQSIVLFLIPFAFAFDDALLWNGALWWILIAFSSLVRRHRGLGGDPGRLPGWCDLLGRARPLLFRLAGHHLCSHGDALVGGGDGAGRGAGTSGASLSVRNGDPGAGGTVRRQGATG